MTVAELLGHFWSIPHVFVADRFELHDAREWGMLPDVASCEVEDWFLRKDVIFVKLR